MIKTLIVNTRFSAKEGIIHLPQEPAYMAAVLRINNFPVEVIDLAIEKISYQELIRKIRKKSPELVVIHSEDTILATRNFFFAIDFAKKISKNFPGIKIAMTGAHVTFRDIETLSRHKKEVSYIIRFEPEYVLLDLVKTLTKNKDISKIKGVTYRKGNSIVRNKERSPIMDLDTLPFPARDLFPVQKYLEKDYETYIQGSRGCTNKCYFCQSTYFHRVLRFRSVSSIIEEVKEVLQLGFKSIFFSDNDFGASEKRLIQFCEEVLKKKIGFMWACNIRADRIRNPSSEKMLNLMKKSGCYRVFIGFETFSDQLLDNINKNIKIKDLLAATESLKKHGISLHASFLFGLPGDTEENIKATINFAKKINPEVVSFNSFIPFPGTPIGDHPEKFGIVVSDKYWYEKKKNLKQRLAGNKNMSPKKLQELVKWAYINFCSDKNSNSAKNC